jgi:hypothetical protein
MTEEELKELNQEMATETEVKKLQINEQQMDLLMSQMESEQNLPFAIVGGLAAAMLGAAIWATITALTEYQIGFMAVGVGLLVGFSVRYFGKGIDKVYGVIGAAFALLGCAAGNFFTIIYFISVQESISILEILAEVDFEIITNLMIETFQPMDVLFYGIAVYEGYRFSFRQITDEDLSQVTPV